MNEAIRALLHPQSIAVIGASTDFNKINGRTFKALVDKGYAGRILPVNPKYEQIAGRAWGMAGRACGIAGRAWGICGRACGAGRATGAP